MFGAELYWVYSEHVGQFSNVVADMHPNSVAFPKRFVYPKRPVDPCIWYKVARLDGMLRFSESGFNLTEAAEVMELEIDSSDASQIVKPVDLLKPRLDDALMADHEIVRQLGCQFARGSTDNNPERFIEDTYLIRTHKRSRPLLFCIRKRAMKSEDSKPNFSFS